MSIFTLKEFNAFLKRVLKEKSFEPIDTSTKYQGQFGNDCESTYYIDFLNLFCLFNNIRNGVHLDQIQTAGDYYVVGKDDEDEDKDEGEDDDDWEEMDDDITIKHRDGTFVDELLTELVKLRLTRFPWLQFNKHYELTIWNSDKVPNEVALHSWAFEGDSGRDNDPTYWKNTALLLGNDLGFPTYTSDPDTRGRWSLCLVISIDGVPFYPSMPFSMAGGSYDKTIEGDLNSILVVKAFLETLIGKRLYHPGGRRVCLDSVRLEF